MISLKTYIITLLAAVLIIAAGYLYLSNKNNEINNIYKKELQSQKEKSKKELDSVVSLQKKNLTNLITENEKAKRDGQYWYDIAKKNSVNPNYDFDFITAAAIISNSHYKPEE